MDKTDGDGENKIQILDSCCSNYALSQLIVDNGLEDLWRRENPDGPTLIFGKGTIVADELGGIWVLLSP